MINKFSLI